MSTRKKRTYTPGQRSAALALLTANNGNVRRTARECGVPCRTLRQWATGQRCPQALQDAIPARQALADTMEGVVWQLLDGITGETIGRATLAQTVVGVGTLLDKARLLQGKPARPASAMVQYGA